MSSSRKSPPRFSVIVPAHNSAEWIRKGLDSIKAQTYRNYELIIVCDACTDNTEQIAREYTDKVYIINRGRDGLARNVGLDHAQGEYIIFMDDDDWFLHEYVFEQLASVDMKDTDMLFFSFIWKGVGYRRQTADHLFVAVWNKLWRRSFIGETRFNDMIAISDLYFHTDMMTKGPMAKTWDMPMYYYNYRVGSLSWRKDHGEFD